MGRGMGQGPVTPPALAWCTRWGSTGAPTGKGQAELLPLMDQTKQTKGLDHPLHLQEPGWGVPITHLWL